jgi:hypothetical protein
MAGSRRGGYREGAGRKPSENKRTVFSFSIDAENVDIIRSVDNRSRFINELLSDYRLRLKK